jgi:hypothetical protein
MKIPSKKMLAGGLLKSVALRKALKATPAKFGDTFEAYSKTTKQFFSGRDARKARVVDLATNQIVGHGKKFLKAHNNLPEGRWKDLTKKIVIDTGKDLKKLQKYSAVLESKTIKRKN